MCETCRDDDTPPPLKISPDRTVEEIPPPVKINLDKPSKGLRSTRLNSDYMRDQLRKIIEEPFVPFVHTSPHAFFPFVDLPSLPVSTSVKITAQALSHNILFTDVPGNTRVTVAQHMAQLSIPAGHKVIQQGDDVTYDDCMFLVEEDSVEVRIAAAQQTSLFESVGFIFGE